mmetsp:Transcript_5680/g.13771  ORF Transcript_5680/g.13771 Transcript_5680/m.13771 type:complete len:84 (-) Transcript_5680:2977-3228(-)
MINIQIETRKNNQRTNQLTHQTLVFLSGAIIIGQSIYVIYAIELYIASILPEEFFDDGIRGSLFGCSCLLLVSAPLDSSNAFM